MEHHLAWLLVFTKQKSAHQPVFLIVYVAKGSFECNIFSKGIFCVVLFLCTAMDNSQHSRILTASVDFSTSSSTGHTKRLGMILIGHLSLTILYNFGEKDSIFKCLKYHFKKGKIHVILLPFGLLVFTSEDKISKSYTC